MTSAQMDSFRTIGERYVFDADPLYPLGEIVVDASYPSGNGWKVQFRNYGKGAAHFTTKVYAVCVYVDP